MNKSKDTVSLEKTSFPNEFDFSGDKADKDYGLKIGRAIEYEWFNIDSRNGCAFYDRNAIFDLRRRYARAEQPTGKYKNQLSINGDLSWTNLSWQNISIIPKFVDIVVNGMQDREFTPTVTAVDAMSQRNKNRYQDMIEGQMVAKNVLTTIKEKSTLNPFVTEPDNLPQDDEQLELHMNMEYKPSVEIAEEVSLTVVLEENKWRDIRKRIDYDSTVVGMCVAKQHFLPEKGISVEYCVPEDIVHSQTEDPNFRDCFYWGEVKAVHISEIYKINPNIGKEDIEKIKQSSGAWANTYRRYINDQSLFSEDMTTLLFYSYKTTKRIVFKKKKLKNGQFKMTRREEDEFINYEPQESSDERFEVVEKIVDVWYEGVKALGCDVVIDWRLAKNMIRPKSSYQNALPRYAACAPRMYRGQIESLVGRMIPYADLCQIVHLKTQQVLQRTVPDGVYIDAAGLVGVNLGNGQNYTPTKALELYFQTGSVVGRSTNSDNEFDHGKVPIQELNKNSGQSKLNALFGAFNQYLDQIRIVTGVNEARDGSDPDSRSLVGIQKMAALNSNTATRHILDAGVSVFEDLCRGISLRISDVLEDPDMRDDFVNKVGQYNANIIESVKNLYLSDFGIYITLSPDVEEKATLDSNIQMALSRGTIQLSDKIDIEQISNIKLANQLLKIREKRYVEQAHKREMEKIQANGQVQMQSAQQTAQNRQAELQLEGQTKIAVVGAEKQGKIEVMNVEAQLKRSLMEQEFMYNMKLKGIDAEALLNREEMKESEKSKRISQQNTEQSKIKEQVANNLPSINFESNEDTLDGFALDGFEPK
jgi:hypothetical protein